MTITISRLYNNYPDAQAAIKRLEAAGVNHGDISVLASNADGWYKDGQPAKPSTFPDRDRMGRMIARRRQAQAQEWVLLWAARRASSQAIRVAREHADFPMVHSRSFQTFNCRLSVGVVIVKTRYSNSHFYCPLMRETLLCGLLADYVALKVHADVHGSAVLRGFPAPDSSIFLKTGNIRKALRLDPRLDLTFRKAVRSSDRSARVRRTVRRVHGGCIGVGIGGLACRLLLCKGRESDCDDDRRN